MAEKKLVSLDTGTKWAAIQFPKDESDPRWMPDMGRPIPKWLVKSIAERGVEVPPEVTEGSTEPLTYLITDGRKRLRAVPEANALRKAKGLPPLVIPLLVTPRDAEDAMDTAAILNEFRVEHDPVVKAEVISRFLDTGRTEEEAAERMHMTVKQVEQYKILLRASKRIQEAVQEGRLSVQAVAEIYKKAPDEAENKAIALMQEAEQTGKRVTKKKAAGDTGPGRMGARAVNQLILNLQSNKIAGPAGENIKWAGIAILQAVQNDSLEKKLWEKLEDASKGRFPKNPDFSKEVAKADKGGDK